MGRLRALYFLPAASFGGAERQAAQIIHALPGLGIDVLPVVGPGPRIVEFFEDAGVERYRFRADIPDDTKAPRGPLSRAALISDFITSFFRLSLALEEEVRRERIELIYASRPFAWVVAG